MEQLKLAALPSDALIDWLERRNEHQRGMIAELYRRVVLNERHMGCGMGDAIVADIVERTRDAAKSNATGDILYLRSFIEYVLEACTDRVRHDKAIANAPTLASLKDMPVPEEGKLRLVESFKTRPQRFAEWEQARDEWQKDVAPALTNAKIRGWESDILSAIVRQASPNA